MICGLRQQAILFNSRIVYRQKRESKREGETSRYLGNIRVLRMKQIELIEIYTAPPRLFVSFQPPPMNLSQQSARPKVIICNVASYR